MKNSTLAVLSLIAIIVVGPLKSTMSHVAWSIRPIQPLQTSAIIPPELGPLSSRENFQNCSGSGGSLCTECVFGIFRCLAEDPGGKDTRSWIGVVMRANRAPSAWHLGLVTCIPLNLQCQELGYMSGEVAGIHNARPYLMDDVMAAFVKGRAAGRAAIFPDRAGTEEGNTGFMRFEAWPLGDHKEGIPRMKTCERSCDTLCEGLRLELGPGSPIDRAYDWSR